MPRVLLLLLFTSVGSLFAQESKPISLPSPQINGGRPLMQVLKERKTTREFAPDKLPLQVLSNLLWAAFGVNRPNGGRTAPSALNWQEIDIYVAMNEGLFRYDAASNRLDLVLARDVRGATGEQDFVANAPVNLVYVADRSKSGSGPDSDLYNAADTGFIAQNVYLFCASQNLATVVRGSVNREALAKIMNLRKQQKIILTQTVGYPKK